MRLPVLAVTLVATAALSSGAANAQNLTPHTFKAADGTTVEAQKGWIEVSEDRENPRSRRIKLHFVRFPSTAAKPGSPIVYLAGGPGGSGISTARGARFPIFMAMRAKADVIAYDQRGTGESDSVPFCAASQPLREITAAALEARSRSQFERCWAWWKTQGVAIEGYDTWQNAADLDDLRRALGAKKISLWGISYGSHLALAALKRQPKHIDRVALASLEGLDQTVRLPSTYNAYLARVAALAAAASPAGADRPDLLAVIRRVHGRLDAAPAEVTFSPPPGAAPVTLELGAAAAQLAVSGMIADPETVAQIPALYAALDAGHYEPLAQLIYWRLGGDRQGMRGMAEATDLASGVSAGRLARFRREAPGSLLGAAGTFPMPQLAGAAPEADLGERFRTPFRVRHPAFIVMGSLDGRTPVEEQRDTSRLFTNATSLTVINAGHNVWESHPEVAKRLTAFFGGEPVADTPIMLPPPRFVTGP